MTLDEIGLKYGTDKSSSGHSYLKYYQFFFEHLRDKRIKLCEIGVWKGASLKMWEEYFHDAELILGLDIDEKVEYNTETIITGVCDQSDVAELNHYARVYGPFDIIAEDGSHEAEHQILTFETMWEYVKSGGFYILEDTLCSYDKNRWGKNADVYDRIRSMVGEVNLNGKVDNNRIIANKVEAVKFYDNLTYFEKTIDFVTVCMGTTIIKKL